MPTCIYCAKTAGSSEFDNEHVVSRAISGRGANWTLVDLVCGDCNNKFSTYEVHVYQQSVEALARTFMGPSGRGKPVNGYVEPMKLNHLYVIETGDPLVYEGGFSLPGQFYLRPQLIQETDGSFSALLSNPADQHRFRDAISELVTLKSDAITLERKGREYLVAPLEYRDGGSVLYFKADEIRTKPASCWLRSFPEKNRVPAGKTLSPRFAVREDGTSFVRAADKPAALKFLNDVLAQGSSSNRAASSRAPGTQQFVFLHSIEFTKVMATVLKTGLNLVCHLYGDQIARDPTFDTVRSLVLNDPLDLVQLETVCSISADTNDFPAPAQTLAQHRFMIDVHHGRVRFRMRLYGHLVYSATLAPAVPTGLCLGTTRVVLDYDGAGIRQVSAWP